MSAQQQLNSKCASLQHACPCFALGPHISHPFWLVCSALHTTLKYGIVPDSLIKYCNPYCQMPIKVCHTRVNTEHMTVKGYKSRETGETAIVFVTLGAIAKDFFQSPNTKKKPAEVGRAEVSPWKRAPN